MPSLSDAKHVSHKRSTTNAEDFVARLSGVRRSKDGWIARCPAHRDRNPSLSIGEANGRILLCCHAGCTVESICAALRIKIGDLFREHKARSVTPPEQCNTATLTLTEYANAKKLPVDFLRKVGLTDCRYQSASVVRIPYLDRRGDERGVRFRTALEGENRFRWRNGSKPGLYGLWQTLPGATFCFLVEGESDCHTLWYHGFPAFGLPGAASWNEERDAPYFEGITKIYVVIEPDRGGETMQVWLAKSRIQDRAFLLKLDGFKDPSALHLDDPPRFRDRLTGAMQKAVSFSQSIAAGAATEKAALWDRSKHVAASSDILGAFGEAINDCGVVGEPRIAKLLYLALTTRFLERPVSLAVKGPSSGGKSFLVDQVLRFFPESAVYRLTAMSERVLAYTEADLRHKFLVLFEAAGMSGDFASYLIRSLLSEGRLMYEAVEKTANGLRPRRIEKEGPTGLLVTTTAVRLHPENETRLLSIQVTDTEVQTKAVMFAIADSLEPRANHDDWKAFQGWLEHGEHRVMIPFARQLAGLVPAIAVRLRRDFGALLALIKAHAIIHQASRQLDTSGQLIAKLEDYVAVRELVIESLSYALDATVSPAVRETVEAVQQSGGGETEISITRLAQHLKLDKSATSRRVADAISRGYLRNLEDRKGRPARLIVGDAMPEHIDVLPELGVLQCCAEEGRVNTSVPVSPCTEDTEGDVKSVEAAEVEKGVF